MRRLAFLLKKLSRKLLRLKGTPHNIALGFSLGICIGFTPTFGFQMLMIFALNSLFKANRLAGLCAVQVTNPLTALPIYLITCLIGSTVLGGSFEMASIQDELRAAMELKYFWFDSFQDWGIHWEGFHTWWNIMLRIGAPLWVGGSIVGVISGLAAYRPCLWAVGRYRRHVASRRERRRIRIETRILNAKK